jgi:hypothetical protein
LEYLTYICKTKEGSAWLPWNRHEFQIRTDQIRGKMLHVVTTMKTSARAWNNMKLMPVRDDPVTPSR